MPALVYPSRMKGGHEKTPEVTTPTLPLGSVPLTSKVVHMQPNKQEFEFSVKV